MKSLSHGRVSDCFYALVVACLVAGSRPAYAGEGALGPDDDGRDTVTVVGVTPVQGAGLPADQVPSNVQTLSSAVIQADHAETVTDLVERHLSSVSLADTEGSPFQQDLVERGYTASPVLGTPQGLAIYQNGVRLNEPFGDAVLWDFVPVFAIDTLQELPGSNPVFGLNALGGAVTLQMKNGFDAEGATLDLAGGSFGRVRAIAQLGLDFDDTAVYVGSLATHEDGWRQLSPADLVQGFGDVAIRRDGYTLGASLTMAAANLNGNGADPAEDDRRAAFAVPDSERDRLVFLQTRGTAALTDTLSLQGTAYLRYANLRIENGAASGFAPCGQTVCDDSGPLELVGGGPVPQTLPYAGTIPVTTTQTLGLGGAVQATLDRPLGGLANVANIGASFDQGSTHYSEVTLLGGLVFLAPPGTVTLSDGVALAGPDYAIRLAAVNRYYGLFFTDTLSLTEALNLTVSGRFNLAAIRLSDRLGDTLNGNHSYDRLNPSAGLTWQVDPSLNLYASYSEANRIPTAAELSCADPTQPCRFPLGFISDPSLDQVVARTVELGLRGHVALDSDATLSWSSDIYAARNQNDILFVSSGPLIGSGYFRNAGATQRLGAEAALEGTWHRLDFHADYGYVRATFRSNLTILSADNPAADANGAIYVHPGDRLPEIPLHTGKLGAGYALPWGPHVGLDAVLVASQVLRGDEANLQKPLPAYGVLNAHADWPVTDRLTVYVEGENILDHRYDSFGLYSDPTGNGAFPNFSNPRFYTPGQPFGWWLGLRWRL